jgi:hypothetical protein
VRSSGGVFQTTNARVEKPKESEPRGEPAMVTMTDTAARKIPDTRLEAGRARKPERAPFSADSVPDSPLVEGPTASDGEMFSYRRRIV